MESTGCSSRNVRKTRLQQTAEKRKTEEKMKQQAELKRQKKMFEPRVVIGVRDIVVNSNLPNIKEEEMGCSSTVKLEVNKSLTNEPLESIVNSCIPQVKMDIGESVKVEEMLDLEQTSFTEQLRDPVELTENSEDIDNLTDFKLNVVPSELEQNLNSSDSAIFAEVDQFSQNHTKLLKVLTQAKDQEIQVLAELIKGLQLESTTTNNSSNGNVELDQINGAFSSPIIAAGTNINSNSDIKKIVKQTRFRLKGQEEIISGLSMKMQKLQNVIIGEVDSNLHYQPVQKPVQEPFEMVLPFLYPVLQLNDILRCRSACRSWQRAVDAFLSTKHIVIAV